MTGHGNDVQWCDLFSKVVSKFSNRFYRKQSELYRNVEVHGVVTVMLISFALDCPLFALLFVFIECINTCVRLPESTALRRGSPRISGPRINTNQLKT